MTDVGASKLAQQPPLSSLGSVEVLRPPRQMHVIRASFLLTGSVLIMLISGPHAAANPADAKGLLIAATCISFGVYYAILALRARVVLTSTGLSYRGIGPTSTLNWMCLASASTSAGVRQAGVPLIRRVGVLVTRTDGSTFWLPGFDSGSPATMDAVVERLMAWRAAYGVT